MSPSNRLKDLKKTASTLQWQEKKAYTASPTSHQSTQLTNHCHRFQVEDPHMIFSYLRIAKRQSAPGLAVGPTLVIKAELICIPTTDGQRRNLNINPEGVFRLNM